MTQVTMQSETLVELLDMDLFSFAFHSEIDRVVIGEASKRNQDVYTYLANKYPSDEITVENEDKFRARAFLDRLSSSNVIL